ncbi:MAG TPA: hypothetical protein VMV04_01420 [Thermodesulfobacteriota bacterium]|nr:hypothetical protein [Thermodesulfobacteriota bacterium]
MGRKIIIKTDDFDNEIRSFLREVGADMPVEWTLEALDQVKNAVIEAFKKMGVGIEVDRRFLSLRINRVDGVHRFRKVCKS